MTDSLLLVAQEHALASTPTAYKRYMHSQLPWQSRMFGLVGPRGIGKSTLVKQHLMEQPDRGHWLYVSADNLYFSNNTLYAVADEFQRQGGRHLIIDEVHKYDGWSRELKNIYDTFGGLQVIFTGSSILDIYKGIADLSRRALIFTMQGLSFREFLGMWHGIELPKATLDDLVEGRVAVPPDFRPYEYFGKYLAEGYYPFSGEDNFAMRMQQVVTQTVESDIMLHSHITVSLARKLVKLLGIIAQLAPFKPSYTNLAVELGASRNDIPEYLGYLERAGMIAQLRNQPGGLRSLGKIEKTYVDNPSLMTVLAGGRPNVGNLRETFFFNQMRVGHDVTSSPVSDFLIDGRTFEVGGHKKGFRQIEGVAQGYVVRDDVERTSPGIVPLWQFGLTY